MNCQLRYDGILVFRVVIVFEIVHCCASLHYRGLAVHGTSAAETEQNQAAEEKPLPQPKATERSRWFSRLLDQPSIDTGTEQHSSRLSDKDTVYEIQCKLLELGVANYCSGHWSSAAEGPNQPAAMLRRTKQ